MIHTWSLWNKWFSGQIIRDNGLQFEDFTHLEDAVFLYSYLRYAGKIYTCPHIIYTYVKPLPVIGSTTTQRIDPGLLDNADRALGRLCSLTEDYGEEFRRELIYRYLNTPLIGDYYRRIWKLPEKTAEELAVKADTLLTQIDDDRRSRLVSHNIDVFTADGSRFLHPSEIAENPLAAVYITDKVSRKGAEALLTGLYDQAEVSFRVIADSSHKGTLGDRYERFPNFSWSQARSGGITDYLVQTGCRYAAVIDADLLYNHGTLNTMIRALEEDTELDFVGMKYAVFDGENISDAPVITMSYDDDIPELDVLLANKLFRTSSPALADAVSSMYTGSLFGGRKYLRLESPVMLSIAGTEADPALTKGRSVAKQYTGYMKSKEPSVKQKARKWLKGMLGRTSPAESKPAAAAKPPKKNKLSVSADFYINLDVDPDLVVIEGLGKRPKGSSLYILRELKKPEYSGFRICFVVKEDTAEVTAEILEREGMSDVMTVTAGSDEYKRALFTAGYLFNEVDFPNWWTPKPDQLYVNIWHGTPLKALTKAKEVTIHHDATSSRNFTMADYMLFANEYSIEHILMDCDCGKLTNAKGLMLGYPRTAMLFDTEKGRSVRRECGLRDKTVAIWMPTWNDDDTDEGVNGFLSELDSMMPDDMLMYVNLHHRSMVTVDYSPLRHIREFPGGYDIYEFLTASDMLITDYSSIFFDYAACRKKIILHCPNISDYKAARGFNMDIRDLPFPITETCGELIREMTQGKNYDDSEFVKTFNAYDSGRNTELLLRSMLLGDFREVEVRTFEKEDNAVFLVLDSFREGPMLDMVYELSDTGRWTDNIYLSFQEKVADADLDNVYPLIRNVPIFATKGKQLTARTERTRLYNTIDIKKFILADPADHQRIRAFSSFPEQVFMILTDRQAGLLEEGDKKLLKAINVFARYGNGIYTLSEELRTRFEKFGIKTELIRDTDEFLAVLN